MVFIQLAYSSLINPQHAIGDKAPFIATQLNSTGRPVESICVAIN